MMNRQTNAMMLAFWPQPSAYMDDAVAYYEACVTHVLAHAEADGVAIRVDRQSRKPLAMGNHIPVVVAWGHKP